MSIPVELFDNSFSETVLKQGPLKDLSGPTIGFQRSIYFPTDLQAIDHWVTFRAFKFDKLNQSNTRTNGKTPQMFISLPIPLQLQTSYSADYENASGVSTELAASAAANVMDTVVQSSREYSDAERAAAGNDMTAVENLRGIVSKLITGKRDTSSERGPETSNKTPQAVANLAAIAANALAGAGGSIAAAASAGVGIARNPFNVLLYNGAPLRTHRFSYRLTAREKKDSNSIREIIAAFKYFMSGEYGIGGAKNLQGSGGPIGNPTGEIAQRAFFEYPEYFDISFHYPNYLFSIGPSVLKSFSVNYHPENYPAYVREGGKDPAPLEVSIDMEFQERDIVTKREIINENR